ncbi:MAG: segment 11/17 [Pseudomonadota bacterium]|jgi:hypothetical protein
MKKIAIHQTAAPQLIAPLDSFDIEAPIKDCVKHFNKSVAVEEFIEGHTLRHLSLSSSSGFYFLYDAARRDINYAVQYSTVEIPAPPHETNPPCIKGARQVFVWRNRAADSAFSAGIADKVFWEYLMPKYGCLVSDSQQTDAGKAFWQHQITKSLKKGLSVRLINLKTKEAKEIKTLKDFSDVLHTAWGKEPWFQNLIFAIHP